MYKLLLKLKEERTDGLIDRWVFVIVGPGCFHRSFVFSWTDRLTVALLGPTGPVYLLVLLSIG